MILVQFGFNIGIIFYKAEVYWNYNNYGYK